MDHRIVMTILRRIMKIGVIDMGTNTFHLLLAEVIGSDYTLFRRERRSVKIGARGINNGVITDDAWSRGIAAIKEFHSIIEEEHVEQVFATGTSAIRNASNGSDFTKEIAKATGIQVEIISGKKEAELIHLGVKNALQIENSPLSLIMDIGGGSIEFIIANNHETFWLQSFEIGGQRMVEKFHKQDPISSTDIALLIEYFNEELETLEKACEKYEPKTLIGCSGTFDTLSDIYLEKSGHSKDERATEYPLPVPAFFEIHEELVSKSREERLRIPGMVGFRAEMIVVASLLVDYIIRKFHIQKIRVSGYALKEGVLIHSINQARKAVTQ